MFARFLAQCVVVVGVIQSSAAPLLSQDPTRREAGGEVALQPAYASLVNAVSNASPMAMRVATLTSLKMEQIRIVSAVDIVPATKEAEFNRVVEKNAQAIAGLRGALERNDLIVRAFNDHPARPRLSDVIAVDVQQDGAVIIYYGRRR